MFAFNNLTSAKHAIAVVSRSSALWDGESVKRLLEERYFHTVASVALTHRKKKKTLIIKKKVSLFTLPT